MSQARCVQNLVVRVGGGCDGLVPRFHNLPQSLPCLSLINGAVFASA